MKRLVRSSALLSIALLLHAPPASALDGTVVAADGPAAQVRVTAWARPFSWELDALTGVESQRRFVNDAAARVKPLASAKTDKAGHFTLRGLKDGTALTLWADAGPRGQALVEDLTVGAGGAVTVTLGKPYLLDGNALNRGAPGYPYPGAPPASLQVLAVHTRVPLLLAGKTDARGAFKLGHVPAGEYLVLGVGRGLVPGSERATVPPPPPKAAGRDAEEPNRPQVFIPPMLGLRDEASRHQGLVLLSLSDTTSMTGVVTHKGKPLAGARVRLAHAPGDVMTRTTDAAGRFRFEDVVGVGMPYALEATDGPRTLRDCVTLAVEVGGSWCCAGHATTGIKDVAGPPLSCALTLSLDAQEGEAQPSGERCACDASVLDALAPDAGR